MKRAISKNLRLWASGSCFVASLLFGRIDAERLDFSTRILPVLTKAGCNSGACHGAATGQGGFKLSLLGYDPEQDHRNITRELGGRRLDSSAPTNSLFLKKATRQIDHEGDRRIQRTSPEYDLLVRWISTGAPFGMPDLRVAKISVEPTEILASSTNSTAQLRVMATLTDGTLEDVTPLALYSSNDDAVAEVNRTGRVQISGAGSTAVMVRYGGQVAAAMIDRPFANQLSPDSFAAFSARNFVDELTLARWKRLNIPPSPPANDAEFLRRVSLDLTGRLPTAEEVTQFLNEPPSPTKRVRLIDRLLASDEFVDLWTMHLADLLLMSGRRGSEAATQTYHRWLRKQVAENRSWDSIVRALVTANGDVTQVGPANFSLLANDPRDQAEHVSSMFLGVQIGCARCHAHPADRWTQTDYYQFASYFARVRHEDGRVSDADNGEVMYPKTGYAVVPQPLGATSERDVGSRRQGLADWLVSPNNPFFSQAFVNRVWQLLLGRGLVEPVGDLRPTNPGSNPELLDSLARHFATNGFNVRELIHVIVNSETYRLSSQTVPGNERDERFHSHALVKSPSAQVLLDMITQATGVPEAFAGQSEVVRAVQLAGAQTPSYSLDVLGRCRRERSCETSDSNGGGLSQALHLINGDAINARLRSGLTAQVAVQQLSDEEAIKLLYLTALSRLPTSAETQEWSSMLKTNEQRTEDLEDLLWALLNSREFVFNH